MDRREDSCNSEVMCPLLLLLSSPVLPLFFVLPLSRSLFRCPRSCSSEFQPVCGSDGRTYSNSCELQLRICTSSSGHFLYEVANKACENLEKCEKVKCKEDFLPVCGNDGRSYRNKCALENVACSDEKRRGKLELLREGFCSRTLERGHDLACDMVECHNEEDIVCGSNGRSYLNECHLRNAGCLDGVYSGLEVQSKGECEPECMRELCDLSWDPYCGTDGKTYPNLCFLKGEACVNGKFGGLRVAHRGECVESCQLRDCESRAGPDEEFQVPEGQVCGNDGSTYSSYCALENARCVGSRLTDLKMRYPGKCSPCEYFSKNPTCDLAFSPVCGSDGVSYFNECHFAAVACEEERRGRRLEVSHRGACKNEDCRPRSCRLPVPDSPFCFDGVEYFQGVCQFMSAMCGSTVLESSLHPLRFQAHACRESPCTLQSCPSLSEDSSLCGSDGQVYASLCELENAGCVNGKRTGLLPAEANSCGPCQLSLCTIQTTRVCGERGEILGSRCTRVASGQCTRHYLPKYPEYFGDCTAVSSPCTPQSCEDVDEPVCGSDGKTYRNRCMLENSVCVFGQRSAIVVRHEGPCPFICQSKQCEKNFIFEPICATNGVTYNSECDFLNAQCEDGKFSGIELDFPGFCPFFL